MVDGTALEPLPADLLAAGATPVIPNPGMHRGSPLHGHWGSPGGCPSNLPTVGCRVTKRSNSMPCADSGPAVPANSQRGWA